MFTPIMQNINAQRERGNALQRLAKEEATEASKEEQARIMQEEGGCFLMGFTS